MKQPHLHLVQPANNDDDIFERELRSESTGKPASRRRERSAETFARIPHDKALELYRYDISSAAWVTLVELDRLILKRGGQNPVRLNSSRLRNVGIRHSVRQRALRQLKAAGVIKVKYRGNGLAPWVTHLWHPLQG
jgi:hypothetical protein